jgi:hypothetical protein
MAPLVQLAELYVSSVQSSPPLYLIIHSYSADRLQPANVPQFSPLPRAAQALRRGDQDPDDVQCLARRRRVRVAGDGLRSVFCQPQRVLDLGMWRMLFDIMRFNACAVRVLAENDDVSIGEYLQREGYSSRFKDDYLIVSFLTPFLLSLISLSPFFVL